MIRGRSDSRCSRIIVAIEIYGFQHCGYWLVKTALVLWAIDSFLAVALSIYLPVVHFLGHPHGHKEMPPSFMLLPTIVIYTATVAYGVIDQVPVWVSFCAGFPLENAEMICLCLAVILVSGYCGYRTPYSALECSSSFSIWRYGL